MKLVIFSRLRIIILPVEILRVDRKYKKFHFRQNTKKSLFARNYNYNLLNNAQHKMAFIALPYFDRAAFGTRLKEAFWQIN